MTDEQIESWRVEREIARSISDPDERNKALQKVYDHRDEMQMTCIAHQSMRQKEMIVDITELKKMTNDQQKQINKCLETDSEFRRMKERGKGMALGVKIAIAVGSVIGFEALKGLVTALSNIK